MPNRFVPPTDYRPFRAAPVLAEGLQNVDRGDGSPERRAAAGFARLAEQAGLVRDRYRIDEATREGEADAARLAPQPSEISGGDSDFESRLIQRESSGRPTIVNELGYAGLYQFGAPRLADLGMYTPGSGENLAGWSKTQKNAPGKWTGTFSIPGHPEVKTLADFLGSPEAQKAAFGAHRQRLDDEANRDGLDRMIGQTLPGGTVLTRDGLHAMMHLGGAKGAKAALEGRGGADRNGTTVLGYADLGVGTGGGALSITGRGGGWQPRPGMDDRSRAYNAAGRDYWTRLQSVIVADTAAVYEKFKDDPEKLRAGFEALHKVHEADLFPEIRADYENAFQRATLPYLEQARTEQGRRQRAADQGSFLQSLQTQQTEQARAVEAIDPGTPGAIDKLMQSQDAIDRSYDDAAARGLISPVDAVKGKTDARRQTAVDFYGRQADALKSPEEVAALREKMRTDFGAGELAGIDADGWAALDGRLAGVEQKKRAGAAQATAALERRGDDLAARAASGPLDPAERARFQADASTAPDGGRIVSTALARADLATMLRETPLPDQPAALDRLRESMGPAPTPEQQSVLAFGAKTIRESRIAAAEDPVGYAERRGLIAPAPLDLTGGQAPSAVSGALAARVATASAVARTLGVSPRYLRPGEADGLATLAKRDPVGAADQLGAVVAGAGPAAPAVLRELGGASPVLERAGLILAGGGSARATRDFLFGSTAPEGGKLPPDVPPASRAQAALSIGLHDALPVLPGDAARIEATGAAIARQRLAAAGLDAKDPSAGPIIERAMQEAAGARFDGDVQWGGIATISRGGWFGWGSTSASVLLPSSIRSDRFGAVLDAVRDEDLATLPTAPVTGDGQKFRARDLKAARPVSVPGGIAFAAGDPASEDPQWITGPDGRPWVLDPERLADRLSPRVPGAFRGQ